MFKKDFTIRNSFSIGFKCGAKFAFFIVYVLLFTLKNSNYGIYFDGSIDHISSSRKIQCVKRLEIFGKYFFIELYFVFVDAKLA
jgi:hypothetical protein